VPTWLGPPSGAAADNGVAGGSHGGTIDVVSASVRGRFRHRSAAGCRTSRGGRAADDPSRLAPQLLSWNATSQALMTPNDQGRAHDREASDPAAVGGVVEGEERHQRILRFFPFERGERRGR
jgi:hypothetical protein